MRRDDPSGLHATIEGLIGELAGGSDNWAAFARKWNLLPVYMDMGATLALSTKAEVFCLEHDSEDAPVSEPSVEWKTIALISAAQKYPALFELVPTRPDGAADCEECEGVGILRPIEGIELEIFCGTCHGLGWRRITN